MFLLALVDWFAYGRKHFVGPSDTTLASIGSLDRASSVGETPDAKDNVVASSHVITQ